MISILCARPRLLDTNPTTCAQSNKAAPSESVRRTWRLSRLLAVLACPLAVLSASESEFPDQIALPNGFQPEGIAIGRGTEFFVGSIPTGAIYKGDLRTGEGAILVPPTQDRRAIGLGFDSRSGNLFVAGGPTGSGFVYDGDTGAPLGQWNFASAPTFINDVVVTPTGAYFTDSFKPVFYRVPLGPEGELGQCFEVIPLGGDFHFVTPGFNSNGIDATRSGNWLFIVNSVVGEVYRVNPLTGKAKVIDLHGESLTAGDGILLRGDTLYVVRNQLNLIAVIKLDSKKIKGRVVDTITDPRFRVPTTIDRYKNALYAVNARFGVTPTPDTDYDVVRVELGDRRHGRDDDDDDDDHDDDDDDDHDDGRKSGSGRQ